MRKIYRIHGNEYGYKCIYKDTVREGEYKDIQLEGIQGYLVREGEYKDIQLERGNTRVFS